MALVQPDLKKLVAYSSVSHLGFVMLGLAAMNVEGVSGSVFQMLNHGLSTGALFLAVGAIYERRHTRQITDFGGLWKIVPVYSVFFLIAMLSSVGLPGLNGFVGEFLCLLGAFGRDPRFVVVRRVSAVVLGALVPDLDVSAGDLRSRDPRGESHARRPLAPRDRRLRADPRAGILHGRSIRSLSSRAWSPPSRRSWRTSRSIAKSPEPPERRASDGGDGRRSTAGKGAMNLPAVDWVPLLPLFAVTTTALAVLIADLFLAGSDRRRARLAVASSASS